VTGTALRTSKMGPLSLPGLPMEPVVADTPVITALATPPNLETHCQMSLVCRLLFVQLFTISPM